MTPEPPPIADIVIFTVNKHETTSLNAAFASTSPARPIDGRSYYDLGLIGGARVLHAVTQMGDQATSAAARHAIASLRPRLLLCVGVAWGAKPNKWNIGDVLLATRLHDWAHRKESAVDGIIPRGFSIPPEDGLIQMTRTAFFDWQGVPQTTKPSLHDGLLLSAPILYDDEIERNKAINAHPEAIGGEMEGRGLVWEAHQAKIDWLVVKAICDWGAGKNAPGIDKEAAQKLAAANSASFLRLLIESQLGPSFAHNSRLDGSPPAIAKSSHQQFDALPGQTGRREHAPQSQLGSSSEATAIPSFVSGGANSSTAPRQLKGWVEVTDDFLQSYRRDLDPDALRLFYDGQEPNWTHALASDRAIPRREVVAKVVAHLAAPKSMAMALLVAAGGEGKSLALRQAAVDLAAKGCSVLWREDDGDIDAAAIAELPRDKIWILCSDDGEVIAPAMPAAIRRLHEAGIHHIHLLVGARDTDWRTQFPKAGEPPWFLWSNVWPKINDDSRRAALGLTRQDATKVVAAWEAVGSLGKLGQVRKVDRSRVLFEAARNSDGANYGTFFGAVLDERFDADGLRAHLEKMLQRLSHEGGETGRDASLRHAFLYAAAAEAVGIDGVDLKVVADLVGVERKRMRPEVLHKLGQEAAAAGGGNVLRTRAPAIARAAIQLVEAGRIDEDLTEIYRDLVRVTGELGRDHDVDISHGEIMHIGPRLFTGLVDLQITPDRAKAIARAAADEAIRVDPDKLGWRITHAHTYFETGDARHGSQLLRDALARPDAFVDWRDLIRAGVFELGLCEGGVITVWLAGVSLSDITGLERVSEKQAKQSLGGLGKACIDAERDKPLEKPLRQLLRAVSVLGPRVVPSQDARGNAIFRIDAEAADRLQVPTFSADEALLQFAAAVQYARERVSDPALLALLSAIAGAAPLTFKGLRQTLRLAVH